MAKNILYVLRSSQQDTQDVDDLEKVASSALPIDRTNNEHRQMFPEVPSPIVLSNLTQCQDQVESRLWTMRLQQLR